MTANQLRQVLRTYTTQWLSWLAVAMWLLMHVMLFSPMSEESLDFAVWISLLTSVNVGAGLGVMLKLQFANPRTRLLPGFRAAHLVVAGAIVAVAIAIQAFLVMIGGGAVSPLFLTSLTLLAITASAWNIYLMNGYLSWVYLFPFMCLMLAPLIGPEYFAGLVRAVNDSSLACLGMACAGLAATAALGMRVWRLSEEMPE